MPGVTGWDYLAVDPVAHTLYLTDNSGLIGFDIEAMRVIGRVPTDLSVTGVGLLHAVAIDTKRRRGFLVHEVPASVVAFDLQTRVHVAVIGTDPGPDALVFDQPSSSLFAMSAKVAGKYSVTVIDAEQLNVVAHIALPGRPEFAVSDGAGSVYVNIADHNAIARLDTHTKKVVANWPLAGCEEPAGLAIDDEHGRLFASCDNRKLVMVDATNGKVLASVVTGEGTDAVAFDSATANVFASNGESGTLTIAHVDSARAMHVVQQLVTAPGARTLALDLRGHRIFLLAGMYGSPPKVATAENPHRYPSIQADTAKLLVVSQSGETAH